MIRVRPFKAIRYNKTKIADINSVICPPYDVIDAKGRQIYQNQSPYNMVGLILPQDTPSVDKYSAAEKIFCDWLKKNILIRDESEGIYFLRQNFLFGNTRRVRLGFIALLGLSEDRGIFPHEHTNLAPREDRLQLLRKVRANLSPIFVLFKDRQRIINATFDRYLKKEKPLLKFTDREGIENELWCLRDKEAIDFITRNMRRKSIFIADGHHRFEVACNYLKEQKELNPNIDPDAPVNFIMAYFTSTKPDNLVIMPIHRLIRGVKKEILTNLDRLLTKYFAVKNCLNRKEALRLLKNSQGRRGVFVLYRQGKFSYLCLKNSVVLDKIIAIDKPREFKRLDVTVFNYLVLKDILDIDVMHCDNISYMHNAQEAISVVDKGEADFLFMLNSIKIEQLLKVASAFEKMPPKSTFFYPKILTGLTIHKFD